MHIVKMALQLELPWHFARTQAPRSKSRPDGRHRRASLCRYHVSPGQTSCIGGLYALYELYNVSCTWGHIV